MKYLVRWGHKPTYHPLINIRPRQIDQIGGWKIALHWNFAAFRSNSWFGGGYNYLDVHPS